MDDHLAYIRSLPILRLTPMRFGELSTYSCSLPTGTTPGKMWRRLDGDHDLDFKARGGKPRWMIGQYDPECPADATTIAILWFRPVIVLTADMPRVVAKPHMFGDLGKSVKSSYKTYKVSRNTLLPEVNQWLYDQGIEPRDVSTKTITFYRRDDALAFKMRWY